MRTFLFVASVLTLAASASAAPVERRLHIGQADASSSDKNDYNRFEENYLPLYVADDDATTAWTEGVPGDGAGEWLRIHFSSMKGATKVRLRIRNGYQKSHKLFLANERARKVTFTLLPSGTKVERELKDAEGWQDVVLEQPGGVLAGVEMKIGSVFKGAKYEDLCISDVQVFVTAETPDNPAYERSVFDKVRKWKAERLEAAQTFAQAARDRPLPVAASYDVKSSPYEEVGGKGPFHALDELDDKTLGVVEHEVLRSVKGWLAKDAAAFESVSLSTTRPDLPRIDGLCSPGLESCEYDNCEQPIITLGWKPLLTTDSFRLIEAKDRPPISSALDESAAKKYKACNSREGATLAWAVREGDARQTRALVVMACGVVEGREGKYIASRLELLAYDASGRLRVATSGLGAAAYAWSGEGVTARIHGGSFVTLDARGTFEAATAVATTK